MPVVPILCDMWTTKTAFSKIFYIEHVQICVLMICYCDSSFRNLVTAWTFCHVDIHTLFSLGNSYLSGIQFIFNVYLLNLTLSLTGFKVKFYLWRIVNDLVGI